jgi:nicotinamidase-related amidase
MGHNPWHEEPYDLSRERTIVLGVDFQQGFGDEAWEHTPDAADAVTNFSEAAATWRHAGGRVIMCREMYYPSDFPGPDGEPIAGVVHHHPLMSGNNNTEFYPGLVERDDIVTMCASGSQILKGMPDLARAGFL